MNRNASFLAAAVGFAFALWAAFAIWVLLAPFLPGVASAK